MAGGPRMARTRRLAGLPSLPRLRAALGMRHGRLRSGPTLPRPRGRGRQPTSFCRSAWRSHHLRQPAMAPVGAEPSRDEVFRHPRLRIDDAWLPGVFEVPARRVAEVEGYGVIVRVPPERGPGDLVIEANVVCGADVVDAVGLQHQVLDLARGARHGEEGQRMVPGVAVQEAG